MIVRHHRHLLHHWRSVRRPQLSQRLSTSLSRYPSTHHLQSAVQSPEDRSEQHLLPSLLGNRVRVKPALPVILLLHLVISLHAGRRRHRPLALHRQSRALVMSRSMRPSLRYQRRPLSSLLAKMKKQEMARRRSNRYHCSLHPHLDWFHYLLLRACILAMGIRQSPRHLDYQSPYHPHVHFLFSFPEVIPLRHQRRQRRPACTPHLLTLTLIPCHRLPLPVHLTKSDHLNPTLAHPAVSV